MKPILIAAPSGSGKSWICQTGGNIKRLRLIDGDHWGFRKSDSFYEWTIPPQLLELVGATSAYRQDQYAVVANCSNIRSLIAKAVVLEWAIWLIIPSIHILEAQIRNRVAKGERTPSSLSKYLADMEHSLSSYTSIALSLREVRVLKTSTEALKELRIRAAAL